MDKITQMAFGLLLVLALFASVYITHRLMRSQSLVDALISTGHYTDLRPTATYEAERDVLAKYGIDIDEVSAR